MSKAIAELNRIQKAMKVPKTHWNKFSEFYYRNLEDITEEVKKHLGTSILTFKDDLVLVGERYYIKSIARLDADNGEYFETVAFAREPLAQKGMNDSQLSGACSSYCRKYAANALFCLDDNQDVDAGDNSQKPENAKKAPVPSKQQGPMANQSKDNKQVNSPQKSTQAPSQSTMPNGYIIPFGKFAKLSLKDIADGKVKGVCMEDIYKYVDYLEESAKKEQKTITGNVQAFISEVEKYA